MARSKARQVVVRLDGSQLSKITSRLNIYVADKNGNIVETTPVDSTEVTLQSEKSIIASGRVFIAHAFPEDYPAGEITLLTLVKAGAFQVALNFTNGNQILVPYFHSSIREIPNFSFCNVVGTINNTISVNGLPSYTGPVCNARVHICEVEWIPRWPIWLQDPIKPEVLTDLQSRFTALKSLVTAKAQLPLRSLAAGKKTVTAPDPLPDDIYNEVQSATTETIYSVVLKNRDIIFPYFCWWPWFWPWFWEVIERTVVYTDCNGYFDAAFFRINDWPENIYLWIEVNINGEWVTVYRPPFPCYTTWNYRCGSDIDITLSDPAILPCGCEMQVTDGSVVFTTIGNNAYALNIQQGVNSSVPITQNIATAPGSSTIAIYNSGCTNLLDANNNEICPFGGTLDFNLIFGDTAPSGIAPDGTTKVATHYRWSYAIIANSSQQSTAAPVPTTSPVTFPINNPASRGYFWFEGVQYEHSYFSLLDKDANGTIAYIIPGAPPASPTGAPTTWDSTIIGFTSMSFNSNTIPSGSLVRFDLQLMYQDNNGVFQPLSVADDVFQVIELSDLNQSTDAPDDMLTPDPNINGNALNLSVNVMVDNSAVVATINAVYLVDANGNTILDGSGDPIVSGPCGFINFTDAGTQYVRISFQASEPLNFAVFGFSVWKGNSGGLSPETVNGYVFSSVGIYTLSGGTFTADILISDILGGCPQAAYSGLLQVYSLATDGYLGRTIADSYLYGDESTIAFALSPANNS